MREALQKTRLDVVGFVIASERVHSDRNGPAGGVRERPGWIGGKIQT
jgi:hypothetical protein